MDDENKRRATEPVEDERYYISLLGYYISLLLQSNESRWLMGSPGKLALIIVRGLQCAPATSTDMLQRVGTLHHFAINPRAGHKCISYHHTSMSVLVLSAFCQLHAEGARI